MLSLWITRWLLGYVRFSISGGNPERFFTYCTRLNVYFWEMSGRGRSGACVLAGSYRRLRGCARRAGCKLRVKERHGLPFLFLRMRPHRGLLVGAAVFLLILYLLSGRVWCVEFSGNSKVKTEDLEKAFTSAGLYPGISKKQLDAKQIGQKVMLQFPDISWLSVNTKGSFAQIRLMEKTEKPAIPDVTAPCNIKAARTGQIVALHVYAGTALVHQGDGVVEGQLLVSALQEGKYGDASLKHASAEVIAETTREVSAEIPLKQRVRQPTGKIVSRYSFNLLGLQFPLTVIGKPHGDYDVTGERFGVSLFGTVLPLEVFREDWFEQQDTDLTLTRQQALEQAQKKIAEQEKALPAGLKILSSVPTEAFKDNSLVLTAALKCEENIAQESEILIKS